MSPLGRAPRHPHPVPPARAPRTAATTAGSAWACRAHTAPLLQHAARPGWGRGSAEHRALCVATVNEAPAPCSPAFLQAPRPQVRRSLRTGERCPQDLGLTARPTRGSAGSPAALTLSVRPGGRVRPPLGRQTELRGPCSTAVLSGACRAFARTRVLRMHAQSTHTSVCVNTRAHTHTLRPRTNALPWAPPQRLQPACLTREPLTVWSRLAEDGLRLLGVSASARGSRVAEGPGSGARRRSGAVPVAWVELGRASRALL